MLWRRHPFFGWRDHRHFTATQVTRSGSGEVPLCACPAVKNPSQMNAASILLLAFAMSTDAFAAAVGKGSALLKPRWSEALRTGAIFGVIEALTPLAGWALGYAASDYVKAWDHWIAFVLLLVLGGRMLLGALRAAHGEEEAKPARHGFWLLVATGFATSIDAMAVGVGLAFLDVSITTVALAIGLATFAMVTLGVMVGRLLGSIAGRWAEAVGGVLLIGIGSVILYEHLSAI
jgi:putative Mn2+ efflux pump MntP